MRWADADGLTALHWAARAGQPAAVDALLAAGAEAEGHAGVWGGGGGVWGGGLGRVWSLGSFGVSGISFLIFVGGGGGWVLGIFRGRVGV